MKKISLSIIIILSLTPYLFSQIVASFNYADEGQRVCLVDVTINQEPASVTLNFLDALLNNNEETSVYRRSMYGSGSDWVLQVANLPAGTESWTDVNVNLGEVWEYQIRRHHSAGDALGYVCAAVYLDQSDYMGQMILLVADDIPEVLPNEYLRLKKDLTGDGWYINEIIVDKGQSNFDVDSSVVLVKNQIIDVYNAAPESDKPKVLFVLGHVPLPRSGQDLQPPDNHIEATGARGSDVYYADLDGVFTDTSTYDIPEQFFDLQKNYPGDYRWDQDKIPSSLEMAFGRASFTRAYIDSLPVEVEAMRIYLDKLHAYRNVSSGTKIGTTTAFFRSFYTSTTDASYRCLPALSKGENIVRSPIGSESGHNQWVENNGPFLWYMQNRFVPQVDEWESIGMDALVFSSTQSAFGYGDIPYNGETTNYHPSVVRRILGYDTKNLIILWTPTLINVFHQAGVGEPLGVACKHIMDHNESNQHYEKVLQAWDKPDLWNRTHFNFFGDPTLRLYQTFPPGNIAVVNNTSSFNLEWEESLDPNLLGYHVYKSEEEFGIYNRITGPVPIEATQFTDPLYQTGNWYMVRAIAEQTTGSGIFLNPSQGIFIQGEIIIAVDQLDLSSQIDVFPNPAKNELNINASFKNKTSGSLMLYDVLGKAFYQYRFNEDNLNHRIDVNSFAPGIYLLEIRTDGGRFVEKVMILE